MANHVQPPTIGQDQGTDTAPPWGIRHEHIAPRGRRWVRPALLMAVIGGPIALALTGLLGGGWPARELHLFGAGVDSGTYDYFTQAVNGKEGASRGDFTSSEDDNVLVQGIGNDELSQSVATMSGGQRRRVELARIDPTLALRA